MGNPDRHINLRDLLAPGGDPAVPSRKPDGPSPGACSRLWKTLLSPIGNPDRQINLRDLLSLMGNVLTHCYRTLLSPVGSVLSPRGNTAVLTPV